MSLDVDSGQRFTFLFTDIERSTVLFEKLGNQYPQLLCRHRDVIRSVATEWGGEEIDCRGDEFFLAFGDPDRAARFAAEAQRALAGEPWPHESEVRVRMGIHTGRAEVGADGWVGLDVHRAARVAAAAHGGQVLLSEATAELVRSLDSKRLGEFVLAGLSAPELLFQLVIPGLPDTFPPPRGLTPARRPRVFVADDSVLLREGLALLVERAGWDVVGQSARADDVLAQVDALRPDVVVLDIRMPPTFTDDGLQAAKEIRRRYPDVAVLVLSQYAEPTYARELMEAGGRKVGYLLKDRVADVDAFPAALARLAAGEVVLDPELS